MPKRRKKKAPPPIRLSAGPLLDRLSLPFSGQLLVFTDASRQQHGGLAAVLYAPTEDQPRIATRSVPAIGSNELELQAAVFGLEQAAHHFPGTRAALFSDNQDAVNRLRRAKTTGSRQDPALCTSFPQHDLDSLLANISLNWIPGHARCRGNAVADEQARSAASGETAPREAAIPNID